MDGHGRASLGGAGEAAAARHLAGLGMRILERDVRLRNGQIDLIALDGDCLVVVEVKARRGIGFGLPQEAVDRRKLRKLCELAETYRALHPRVGRDIRIDVVAVRLDHTGVPVACEHVPNVLG